MFGRLQFFKKDGTEGSVFPLLCNQECSIGSDPQATIRLKVPSSTLKSILCVVKVNSKGFAKLINKEITQPIKHNNKALFDSKYLIPNDTFFVLHKKIRYENDDLTHEDITNLTLKNNAKISKIPIRTSLASVSLLRKQKLPIVMATQGAKRKRSNSLYADDQKRKSSRSSFTSLKGSKTPLLQRAFNEAEVLEGNISSPLESQTSNLKTPLSQVKRRIQSPRSIQLKRKSSRFNLLRRSVGSTVKTPSNKKSGTPKNKSLLSRQLSPGSKDNQTGFYVSPFINNSEDFCTPPNNISIVEINSTPLPSSRNRRSKKLFVKNYSRTDFELAEAKTPKSSFNLTSSSDLNTDKKSDRKSTSLSKTPASLAKSRKSLLTHISENVSDSESIQTSTSTPARKPRKSLTGRHEPSSNETPKGLSPIIASPTVMVLRPSTPEIHSLLKTSTTRKSLRRLNETFSERTALISSPDSDPSCSKFSGKRKSRQSRNSLSPIALTLSTKKSIPEKHSPSILHKIPLRQLNYSFETENSPTFTNYITLRRDRNILKTESSSQKKKPLKRQNSLWLEESLSDVITVRDLRSTSSSSCVLSDEDVSLVNSNMELSTRKSLTRSRCAMPQERQISPKPTRQSHCALSVTENVSPKNKSLRKSSLSLPSRKNSLRQSRSVTVSLSKPQFYFSLTEDFSEPSGSSIQLRSKSYEDELFTLRHSASMSQHKLSQTLPPRQIITSSSKKKKTKKSCPLFQPEQSSETRDKTKFLSRFLNSLEGDEKASSSRCSGSGTIISSSPQVKLYGSSSSLESQSESKFKTAISSITHEKSNSSESVSKTELLQQSLSSDSLGRKSPKEKSKQSRSLLVDQELSCANKHQKQSNSTSYKSSEDNSSLKLSRKSSILSTEDATFDKNNSIEREEESRSNIYDEDQFSTEEEGASVRQLTLILSDDAIEHNSEEFLSDFECTENVNILTTSPKANLPLVKSITDLQPKRAKIRFSSLSEQYSDQENIPNNSDSSFKSHMNSSSLLETTSSSSFCYEKSSGSGKNSLLFPEGDTEVAPKSKVIQYQRSPKNDLRNIPSLRKLMQTPKEVKSPTNDLCNVQGVSKLLRTPKVQAGPLNDLTDVKGVRRLLKTPGQTKCPRNDYTDVRGLRKLMQTPKINEPLNDLTDVRGVRKLMTTPKNVKSPKNDLSNVFGVKKLLATPKENKEPLNDLSDVVGVRKLMATPKNIKSPRNDLSKIVGVKKLLATPKENKEPLNDLRDVVGVRKLMATPRNVSTPRNDLSDFTGVKNLFATPKEVTHAQHLLLTPKEQPSRLNDFSNVQEVGSLTTRELRKSGVDEILNSSHIGDVTSVDEFDASLNKRPIRTCRSKSESPMKSKIASTSKSDGTNIRLQPNYIPLTPEQQLSPSSDLTSAKEDERTIPQRLRTSSIYEISNSSHIAEANSTPDNFDLLLNKRPIRTYRGKSESPMKSKIADTSSRSDGTNIYLQPEVAKWVKEQDQYFKGNTKQDESVEIIEEGSESTNIPPTTSKTNLDIENTPLINVGRITRSRRTRNNSNTPVTASNTGIEVVPVKQSQRIRGRKLKKANESNTQAETVKPAIIDDGTEQLNAGTENVQQRSNTKEITPTLLTRKGKIVKFDLTPKQARRNQTESSHNNSIEDNPPTQRKTRRAAAKDNKTLVDTDDPTKGNMTKQRTRRVIGKKNNEKLEENGDTDNSTQGNIVTKPKTRRAIKKVSDMLEENVGDIHNSSQENITTQKKRRRAGKNNKEKLEENIVDTNNLDGITGPQKRGRGADKNKNKLEENIAHKDNSSEETITTQKRKGAGKNNNEKIKENIIDTDNSTDITTARKTGRGVDKNSNEDVTGTNNFTEITTQRKGRGTGKNKNENIIDTHSSAKTMTTRKTRKAVGKTDEEKIEDVIIDTHNSTEIKMTRKTRGAAGKSNNEKLEYKDDEEEDVVSSKNHVQETKSVRGRNKEKMDTVETVSQSPEIKETTSRPTRSRAVKAAKALSKLLATSGSDETDVETYLPEKKKKIVINVESPLVRKSNRTPKKSKLTSDEDFVLDKKLSQSKSKKALKELAVSDIEIVRESPRRTTRKRKSMEIETPTKEVAIRKSKRTRK